jgi:hypothetical protein
LKRNAAPLPGYAEPVSDVAVLASSNILMNILAFSFLQKQKMTYYSCLRDSKHKDLLRNQGCWPHQSAEQPAWRESTWFVNTCQYH